MTRHHLDRLRDRTRDYRRAMEREDRLAAALLDARETRAQLGREVLAELVAADVPEGEAFETAGLVVWYSGDHSLSLHHVYLAFYRGGS